MITKEKLLHRKKELEKDYDQLIGQLNLVKGGIVDTNYWIAYLEKEEQMKIEKQSEGTEKNA